jgi:hypothetical protein
MHRQLGGWGQLARTWSRRTRHIHGVGTGDISKTRTARAHGDSSYTPKRTTSTALFAVGVGLLALAGWLSWAIMTGRSAPARRSG